jgi:hypothetical protein
MQPHGRGEVNRGTSGWIKLKTGAFRSGISSETCSMTVFNHALFLMFPMPIPGCKSNIGLWPECPSKSRPLVPAVVRRTGGTCVSPVVPLDVPTGQFLAGATGRMPVPPTPSVPLLAGDTSVSGLLEKAPLVPH